CRGFLFVDRQHLGCWGEEWNEQLGEVVRTEMSVHGCCMYWQEKSIVCYRDWLKGGRLLAEQSFRQHLS
ncbi:uncharacterized protein METZ01_LOCUS361798, partial [marine metagenome]